MTRYIRTLPIILEIQKQFLHDESLINKYKDHTVKKLKKALAKLKSSNSDPTETKYVSRTLRDKLRNNNNNTQTESSHDDTFNHDRYLQSNFWGYVKNVLGRKQTLFPSFTVLKCSIISKNHWPQFTWKNYFQFQTGFESYVDFKFNLTLTHQLNNKLRL